MRCKRCRGAAVMEVRRHNAAFCRDCFLHYVGQQVTRAIAKYRMLGHTDRVLVAVSGGKDSLALWDLLLELGYQADGLYLSLGIGAYSERSKVVCQEFAAARGASLLVHDLAYADLVFDAERAPSMLQVPGAKDVGVELFSMSKSYSMPGWRLAYLCGNPEIVAALGKLKSYLDYGVFQPIQIAGIIALNECATAPKEIRETYRARRDALVAALARAGWEIPVPPATMFAWAPIPEPFRAMGSLEFAKHLHEEAGLSRRYGGIHFEQGDLDARATGRAAARIVWEKAKGYWAGN